MPANVNDFAQVLLLMKQQGMLQQLHFKRAVGVLVRDSMETEYPHCTTNYRSRMAQDVVIMHAPQTAAQYQNHCKKTLRHEHMVPTSVRMAILDHMDNPTVELIARSLSTFGLRATLHVGEDGILNSAGLRSRMPDSFWDPSNEEMFMNPLARYIETGLINNLVQRQSECWFAADQAANLYL